MAQNVSATTKPASIADVSAPANGAQVATGLTHEKANAAALDVLQSLSGLSDGTSTLSTCYKAAKAAHAAMRDWEADMMTHRLVQVDRWIRDAQAARGITATPSKGSRFRLVGRVNGRESAAAVFDGERWSLERQNRKGKATPVRPFSVHEDRLLGDSLDFAGFRFE